MSCSRITSSGCDSPVGPTKERRTRRSSIETICLSAACVSVWPSARTGPTRRSSVHGTPFGARKPATVSVAAYNCASDSCSAESAGAAAGFLREALDVEVAAAARFFGGIAAAAVGAIAAKGRVTSANSGVNDEV